MKRVPRRRGLSPGGPLLLALSLAAAGCGRGGPDGPQWLHLAQGYRPAALEAPGGLRALSPQGGRNIFLGIDAGGVWLETSLPSQEWVASVFPGSWEIPLSIQGAGLPADGVPPQRLEIDGRPLRYLPPDRVGPAMEREPGTFVAVFGRVFAFLEDGTGPPGEARFSCYTDRGAEVDGRWRLTVGRFSGEGLSVWPGDREELVVDLPPASALRLALCGQSAFAGEQARSQARFRVTLDGELLLEETLEVDPEGVARHCELPLPPQGRAGARLVFEVEGPHAYTAFLTPVIGPAVVGDYGARPWRAGRPDVVLFLADTFRADNLESYGGEPGRTPHIDRFAAGGLRFERAWSTATHTLPSHGSMFSGLYPRQHAAAGWQVALPAELTTIAERLRNRGYRTGAVTDSVMVSRNFGLDQGFEWFDELHGDLEGTLARSRAFLEADDGRPLFLFVQSYRAHTPYRVDASTRERLPELGLGREFGDLEAVVKAAPQGWYDTPEASRVARELEALYRGGAADLDRGFGELLTDLEERGLVPGGYTLFASDHGEAFGEHGELYHSGRTFEEQLRVPLILSGPGIEPGVSPFAASLIDLPHTLAELAGVAPDPSWLGSSLVSLDRDRPIFAFQCYTPQERSTLAIVEGQHKLIAPEDAEGLERGLLLGAFDLASDPAEQHDLGAQAPWAAALLERQRPTARALLLPLFGASPAVLSAEDLRQLRELGYAGEE